MSENNNVFDGQGHTVSNWTNEKGSSDMGFIRNWVGTVKNVTIKNANLKTSGRSAIVAAKVYGNIENCHVVECTLTDSYWACGLIAGLYNAGNISGCTVTNSSVKSNGGTGAIVGVVNESAGTRKIENCSVTGTTVYNTGAYGETYSGALICGMINISNSTVEFNNCTYANNTKDGKYVGDLYYSADSDIQVIINGSKVLTSTDAVKEAIGAGETTIVLAAGNYTMPSVSGKEVTISGSEDVVITVDKPNMSGSDITFEGVTVKGSGFATGVQHVNTVTYNGVKVVGDMCLYGEKVVFNNCTFELNNQYIWTYGAKEVEFNGCVFNTNGKAILVYNEGAGANKVTVKDCVFNASAGAKAGAIANQNCAAIEIDNFQSSGVGTAHNVITSGNTYNSNFSGEWRIKNYVAGNAITVNGVAYTQIAVDGKLMTIDANKNVTVQ